MAITVYINFKCLIIGTRYFLIIIIINNKLMLND